MILPSDLLMIPPPTFRSDGRIRPDPIGPGIGFIYLSMCVTFTFLPCAVSQHTKRFNDYDNDCKLFFSSC
jgi:hypothetical protein